VTRRYDTGAPLIALMVLLTLVTLITLLGATSRCGEDDPTPRPTVTPTEPFCMGGYGHPCPSD